MASTIASGILAAIQAQTLIPTSAGAVGIIVKGMELIEKLPVSLAGAEKRQLLVQAIERVAAGRDGVLGSADDLIPAGILENLRMLILGNMVGEIADVVVKAASGNVAVRKVQGCFARWC